MINYIKTNHLSLLIIIWLVVTGIAGLSTGTPSFGSISREVTTLSNPHTFTQGVRVGSTSSNRSLVSGLQFGTCSLLLGGSISIAATTTQKVDCAITGVVSTDLIFGTFATSSATNGGWTITAASASSTDGYATFSIQNNTGAAANIPASVASTTRYLIIR